MSSMGLEIQTFQQFPAGPGNGCILLFVSVRPQLQPVIPMFIQICPEQVFTGVQGSSFM